ncbi:hypothetical protein ILUMI_26085 [Ignelater luminosus]|uniref:Uncharacterized protein n=1 Tax=Ignelater luminosus TaxID=2038154 RepID=A0A8K0C4M9_IGNLU|nr:hypothetical protein ILUMI_26085 [Ignelater luminosus]
MTSSPAEELWKDSHSSSTLYCRPIQFSAIKENTTLVLSEENRTKDLISKLCSHTTVKMGFRIQYPTICFLQCPGQMHVPPVFETCQERGTDHKVISQERKNEIQAQFKSKMGLIVDKPLERQMAVILQDDYLQNAHQSLEMTGID